MLFVVYFFLEIPTNALLHRLKGSLKGWGLAELDLGECWNLSNSMPLECNELRAVAERGTEKE